MPSVRLVSRKLKVFIGSDQQDWSQSYRSFVVAQDGPSEQGYSRATGTLVLQEDALSPESIDPRTNPARWRPGQVVRIEMPNDSGVYELHRHGTLRILEEPEPPTPTNRTLVLEVGCELSWRDTFEFDQDASGVAMGTLENCATVASRLLQASGIDAGAISLGSWPYDLGYPVPKQGGGFISQAGELAFSNDFRVLYCDFNGVVQSWALPSQATAAAAAADVTVTLGVNDVGETFFPLRDPQQPAEELKAVGVGYELLPASTDNTTVDETLDDLGNYVPNASGIGVVHRTTVNEAWSIPATNLDTSTVTKTVTTQVEELRVTTWIDPGSTPSDLILDNETVEVTRYAATPVPKRLERVDRTVRRREASMVVSATPLNFREVETSSMVVNYDELESPESVTVEEWKAEVLLDKYSSTPWTMKLIRRETLSWEELSPDRWRKTTRQEIARIAEDSGVDRFVSNIWSRKTKTQRQTSSTGNCQPQRTEFWEGETARKEQHYEGLATYVHRGGPTGRSRKRLIRVPYGFSDAQCAAIAARFNELLEGRYYGHKLELPISDALVAAGPFPRVDVVAPDGTQYKFVANSLVWSHEAEEAVVLAAGIWVGGGYVTAPAAERINRTAHGGATRTTYNSTTREAYR